MGSNNPQKKKKQSSETASAAVVGRKKGSGGTGLNDWFIVIFGICFVVSFSLNVMHLTMWDNDGDKTNKSKAARARSSLHRAMADFKTGQYASKEQRRKRAKFLSDKIKFAAAAAPAAAKSSTGATADSNNQDNNNNNNQHLMRLAHLDCKAHGGPVEETATQEMVYWQDIPTDSLYASPFFDKEKTNKDNGNNNRRKYLTFEPDGGGWNNIRMSMESTICLAVAMGRTLVMPPQKKMYLLGNNKKGQQHHFNFVDFFPIEEMAADNKAFEVVSMKEYLEEEALKGKLTNRQTGKVEFPPGNRTDWDGIDQNDYDVLRGYLRNVSKTLRWNPDGCLPAFPSSGNHQDVEILQGLVEEVKKDQKKKNKSKRRGQAEEVDDDNNKTLFRVDDPDPLPRLEDILKGRQKLCVYNEEDQSEQVVHFQMNHREHLRLLVHFYGFLFFEDWREDLWNKRFVRDHLRYRDDIQCAAARIVQKVREHVAKRTGGESTDFDSFHVRRGDFQYKETRVDIETIIANTKNELTPGSTIFIATDERDKKFFDPMKKIYDLLFLDDFKKELEGVNSNYYGMIDQLVASRGKLFFGCWFSTFTGYINRIRGYHSVKDRAPGYDRGELPSSYYYATLERKFEMHKYTPLRGSFYSREYPTSWRDIDKGIEELAAVSSSRTTTTQ